jgi:hypothetical protein
VKKLWWIFKVLVFFTATATLVVVWSVVGDLALGVPPQFTALTLLCLFSASFGVIGRLRGSSAGQTCDSTQALSVPPAPKTKTTVGSAVPNVDHDRSYTQTTGAAPRRPVQTGAVFRSAMYFIRDSARVTLRNGRTTHETVA